MKTKHLLSVLAIVALSAVCLSSTIVADDQAGIINGTVKSADGLMIHYQMEGTGDRALVFVHCWSCDCGYWRNQIDVFSKKYRVVTVDLAGHGESDLGRKEWSVAAYGGDVAAVVNELGLKEVILIGHSMGGPVIMEAAKLLPGKVVALIGVDTYQNFSNKPSDEQLNQFLGSFKAQFQQMTKMFVMNMFPPSADSVLVTEISEDMASAPEEVALPSIENTLRYDYVATLKDLRLPIRGVNSDRFPVSVEENRKLAESFDVKLMTGVGHFLQLEKPDEFNKLLQETIDEFWPEEK